MTKYIKLTKDGKIPTFTFKDSIYWIDHDIRHIKDSFKWCIHISPILLVFSIILMLFYAYFNNNELLNLIKFTAGTYVALFFTVFILKVLLDKGYSVFKYRSGTAVLDMDTPMVPADFDDKKYENIEKVVNNLNKHAK